MKLQEKRKQINIKQSYLAKMVGTNIPMMSNFERYKCLPTPKMLEQITEVLRCEVSDIYEDSEIYIKQGTIKQSRGKDGDPLIYKLTVELPNHVREILTQKNLKLLGYCSIKDYISLCIKRLEKRIEKRKNQQTSEPLVGNEYGSIPNKTHI